MAQTVLVVDDYDDARVLLSYVLEDAGFRVIYADTGPTAIAMAREHRPAAIVMDLNLPGMSGGEAARHIRADPALANTPIVAHTLGTDPKIEIGMFDAVFAKPSSSESLVEALHSAIRARSGG